MVKRPVFDQYLVDEAVAAGATLLLSAKARAVRSCHREVTVELADGRCFSARHLIGADGATGIVASQLGLRAHMHRRQGIAREIELPFADAEASGDSPFHRQLVAGAAYLEYGTVPGGYAWIFPKRGALSVGAGVLHRDSRLADAEARTGELLKAAIDKLLGAVGLHCKPDPAPRLWAHPIPEWSPDGPLHTADGRALLVGDAAGVVQPLFGEGIQYAMRSGVLGAQCVLADAVLDYTRRLHALFADELAAAGRASRVFYKLPRVIYHLGVRRQVGARLVSRILSGETTFARVEHRLFERLRQLVRSE
jgi:flavin-dependent dehydrogenase